MSINFDVPLVLTLLVLISGVLALIDIIFLAKKRNLDAKPKLIFEYARSFFPVLLLVLLIRSFLIQPYKVPSGSLEPTILPGDFIAVNQYQYGLRLPVFKTKIYKIGEPKRGDIALFYYPKDNKTIYIKRVIGLPGDHISYHDKVLTINGDRAWQTLYGMDLDVEADYSIPVQVRAEQLGGVTHQIFVKPGYRLGESFDVVVPPGNYFMMGDNRDNSGDSREWGFVPEANLVGKAIGIWMSWDSDKTGVRWDRIGKSIK